MRTLRGRLAALHQRRIDAMLAPYERDLWQIARAGRYTYQEARRVLSDVAALVLSQPVDAEGTIDFERLARQMCERFGWLGLTFEQVMRDGARLAREEGRDWGVQAW
jgi:hypothetical protein